jgi:hypothetical protein
MLMSGAVITVGVFTFGNAILFDRLLLIIFVGLSIIYRKDKNLLSLLIIVLAGRAFEEFFWLFPDRSNGYVKGVIYFMSAVIFYKLREDSLSKFALSILFCMVGAELYWWSTHYENTPRIAYFIVVITEDLLVRHFIFLRLTIFRHHFKSLKRTPLDWQVQNLMIIFSLFYSLHIGEYFIRHILKVPSLLVYPTYPYVLQILNCLLLWFILNYTLRRTRFFKA